MYIDIDKDNKVSINDMTSVEAEIIAVALARIVEQLPIIDQIHFRRLLIDLDKTITTLK